MPLLSWLPFRQECTFFVFVCSICSHALCEISESRKSFALSLQCEPCESDGYKPSSQKQQCRHSSKLTKKKIHARPVMQFNSIELWASSTASVGYRAAGYHSAMDKKKKRKYKKFHAHQRGDYPKMIACRINLADCTIRMAAVQFPPWMRNDSDNSGTQRDTGPQVGFGPRNRTCPA